MITITPFEDEFCQQKYTIYSINETNPLKHFGSSMTTSEVCPKCKTRNIFRVYEPIEESKVRSIYISVYECKCPSCGHEFDIVDEFDESDLED